MRASFLPDEFQRRPFIRDELDRSIVRASVTMLDDIAIVNWTTLKCRAREGSEGSGTNAGTDRHQRMNPLKRVQALIERIGMKLSRWSLDPFFVVPLRSASLPYAQAKPRPSRGPFIA